MKCYNCEQLLPEDSAFCQYCGKKIERQIPIQEASASKDALDAIVKMLAEETVNRLKENMQNQPNNEEDVNFGLVPEKPIYTLALMSVDGEEEYLNGLYTESGIKIKWNRRGSTSVNSVNGMIDVYDTYLPSGEPYKTIYINMYGAKKSEKAPVGFKLDNIETPRGQINYRETQKVKTKFCKLCGNEIDVETKKCSGCGKQYFKGMKFNKLLVTVLIVSLVILVCGVLNIVQFEENSSPDENYEIKTNVDNQSVAMDTTGMHHIDKTDSWILIPEDYILFTRDIDESSDVLSEHGLSKDDLVSYLDAYGAEFMAITPDGNMVVMLKFVKTSFGSSNLISQSEDIISGYAEGLQFGFNAKSYELLENNNMVWVKLEYSHFVEGQSTPVDYVRYATIANGWDVYLWGCSYDGKITTQNLTELQSMCDSFFFN